MDFLRIFHVFTVHYSGVYAYVTLKDGVTESHDQIRQELKDLVKKNIAGYAVPQIIQVRKFVDLGRKKKNTKGACPLPNPWSGNLLILEGQTILKLHMMILKLVRTIAPSLIFRFPVT